MNAGELEARLGYNDLLPSLEHELRATDYEYSRLPSSTSTLLRSRSSSASTFDEEKDKEEAWREEEEAYRALVTEEGRPSHPMSFGYDVIDNPEKYEQYEQYKDIL